MFERTKPDTERATAGDWLGSWQPIDLLANSGSVMLWHATGRNGTSALLRLYPRFQRQDTWRRFRTGAGRRAQLADHPQLAAVQSVGAYGRPHLLLTEPVGEPLATRIEREPLEPELALRVFADVAAGLEALTRAGLAPVDLSPADVFVTGDGGLVLADTGLLVEVLRGRCMAAEHAAPERRRMTDADAHGMPRRALEWISPWHATRPTSASMTYAFASVLRAALAGPDSINFDSRVGRVLDRAQAQRPWRRYRTPEQVLAAVRTALATTPVPARRPPIAAPAEPAQSAVAEAPKRRLSGRALAAVAAACVLLAGAAGALVGALTNEPDPPTSAQLTRSGLSIEAPAGWKLARGDSGPFDTGADALVARPSADPDAGLTVTRSEKPLLASISSLAPFAVSLGGELGAWRYRGARVGASVADVYWIDTTAGPIFAACHVPAGGRRALLAGCAGMLASLRARGAEPVPLGGEAAARAKLSDALATLRSRRVEGRAALAAADRPGRQAKLADSLADAYARAAAAVTAAGTVGPPGAQARLAATFDEVGDAYAALAAAARADSPDAYDSARQQVGTRERAVSWEILPLERTAIAD